MAKYYEEDYTLISSLYDPQLNRTTVMALKKDYPSSSMWDYSNFITVALMVVNATVSKYSDLVLEKKGKSMGLSSKRRRYIHLYLPL